MLVVPLGIVVAGAWVAWSADDARWSALVLHAEPFLLVAAAFAVYGALVTRRPARAVGLLVGTVVTAALLRVPGRGPDGDPLQGWNPNERQDLTRVVGCARDLAPPADDVRLLMWTVNDEVPAADVRAVVEAVEPDVTVLHGVRDAGLADAVREDLGGDSIHIAPEGGGRGAVVHTRGVFHLCGELARWGEAEDSPTPVTVLFAGTTPDTAFPLIVGRLPGPWEGPVWEPRSGRARIARVAALLGAESTVVALDASAAWTYRHLDGHLSGAELAPLSVPPSWPTRVGPVRVLPLQPYDRAWAGRAWRAKRNWRLQAPGPRAPVLLELSPAAAPAPPSVPGGREG